METKKIFGILLFALFGLAGFALAGSAISGNAQASGILAVNQPALDNIPNDVIVAAIPAEPENPPHRDFVETLRVGDVADTGELRVRLSEVGTRNNRAYAIVDILDGENQLLAQATINRGSTYTYTNERLNKRLRITVSNVNLQRQNARLNLVESTLHVDAQRLETGGQIDTGEHSIRLERVDPRTGEAEISVLGGNNRRIETVYVMPGTSYYYRNYRANIRLRINVYYSSTEENADGRWIWVSTRENTITQPRILGVGDSFPTAHFSVRLADVDAGRGEENEHPAILDILDGNGDLIAQTTANPGSTYIFEGRVNNQIRILYARVYATAPGLNLEDKWASMAVTEVRG